MTFEPSEQVLADRIVFHSKDKQDIGGVKVTCLLDRGEKEEIGFLNIFDGEIMTVGWNCEMSSSELRIPRIAVGLVESRTNDDRESRERRGLKEFSIMALNGVRAETFGFSANDRISRFNRMMDSDRVLPTTLLHQSTTGGIGWAVILSIVIAIVGVVIIVVTVQCYKKDRPSLL